jgi:two-component system, OmpR family, phosphate regulon response regulator PhoB
MSARVLIVDDERDLVSTLVLNFQREGYSTETAENGKRALEIATRDPAPDLVILDLMLPDISGMEVCRTLRATPETKNIPIVMLTAKGEEIDRLLGFELGADDYVVKPFSVRELLLRVRVILRRSRPPVSEEASIQTFGCLRLDDVGHRVWVEGEEIKLTALEFRLLGTLMSRRGRVQTRERLLSDVWGIDGDVTTRTVDTHVKRLREKIGRASDYIETLRGVGYRFRSDPDEGEPR